MEGSNDIGSQYGLSSDYVIPPYMTSQDPPPYNAALQSVSPSQQVIMGEQLPDIDMKIRESEFKMKGEIIKLQNRLGKIERDVRLCCPDYDKLTTNIQSRFRGNKDRKILRAQYEKSYTNGWTIIKDAGGEVDFRSNGGKAVALSDTSNKNMKDKSNFGFWRGSLPQMAGMAGIVPTKKALEQILQIIIKDRTSRLHISQMCDFYVGPGIPLKLIKEKIDKGFTIEFEDTNDKRGIAAMIGGGKNKSKKKKSKKKKTRRKKTRRKSKKKKTRRKSKRKYTMKRGGGIKSQELRDKREQLRKIGEIGRYSYGPEMERLSHLQSFDDRIDFRSHNNLIRRINDCEGSKKEISEELNDLKKNIVGAYYI